MSCTEYWSETTQLKQDEIEAYFAANSRAGCDGGLRDLGWRKKESQNGRVMHFGSSTSTLAL